MGTVLINCNNCSLRFYCTVPNAYIMQYCMFTLVFTVETKAPPAY